jgi:uncharacterized phiE125 gp8 family phage protein
MGAGATPPIVAMSEAQAYVRIETGEEEAILAGLIRSASALCETFINQIVIARQFETDLPASGAWERIALTPVRSITTVAKVDAAGASVLLPADGYSIDIDSSGDGWVRTAADADAARIEVTGTAGMADDENSVPEPLRQGVLRLVAHLFEARDGDAGRVPASVTALWRPYRRLRLA